MSDTPLDLPPRPSLQQLRKQAKERLDAMPEARLADAQLALARDYGFESWPKLARHVEAVRRPEVAQHERIARDMVAAFHRRDEEAVARLNDLFHSMLSVDRIRDFIGAQLVDLPAAAERLARFEARDARLLVARLYGFEDWDALIMASTGANAGGRADAPGLSTTAPFHRIDAEGRSLSIQQPMSRRDWDTIIGIMRDRGIVELEAQNMLDDEAMAVLAAAAPHVRILKLHGSDRVTDVGLKHLAAFRDLERIELGGWHSAMTDTGFAALRGLPRLRSVGAWWSRRITDAGARQTLADCHALEDGNFGGTPLGDGLIEALAGKPGVWRVFCGDGVTDAGLARLRDIPRLQHWSGGERRYSLLEFDAGPTYVAVKGPFTAAGLQSLAGLDGLFALNVHWTSSETTSRDLGRLASLTNLGFLAIDGDLCDDEAMRQIGQLPALRMLLAQQPVAGDDGFAGLSASKSLEYLWGRQCPGLTGRGFTAMASMPSLTGLAVSCKNVDDDALTMLPRFPSLRALMPMDVGDEGFRHVGRCEHLAQLWCMYCRDTGDAATEHVANLRLKIYYAGSTQITDRSLLLLSRMLTLERIHLHHCQKLTNAGVQALVRHPTLHELSIEGCRNVTRAGVANAAPHLRVSYSAR
ncbi:MAG TPA: hypothetical protein VGI12_12845 [Vicinamibacterales bacterium]|jgi:hypothetical protein